MDISDSQVTAAIANGRFALTTLTMMNYTFKPEKLVAVMTRWVQLTLGQRDPVHLDKVVAKEKFF